MKYSVIPWHRINEKHGVSAIVFRVEFHEIAFRPFLHPGWRGMEMQYFVGYGIATANSQKR